MPVIRLIQQVAVSPAAESTLKGRVLDTISEQGEVGFGDLVALGIPEPLVKHWIYELVHSGKFKGFINWKQDKIYSRAAKQLTDSAQCPGCGGQLGLAAGGVARCRSCGGEVMT